MGRSGDLPWHIPEDLKFFKATTLHGTILMGRRTFESVGKPLPKRRNIVVSRQRGYVAPGCETAPNLAAALELCRGDNNVLLCGGSGLYAEGLPLVQRMYISHINKTYEADTFFPAFDPAQFRQKTLADFVTRGPGNPRVRIVQYDRK